jgi:hypothetical protein
MSAAGRRPASADIRQSTQGYRGPYPSVAGLRRDQVEIEMATARDLDNVGRFDARYLAFLDTITHLRPPSALRRAVQWRRLGWTPRAHCRRRSPACGGSVRWFTGRLSVLGQLRALGSSMACGRWCGLAHGLPRPGSRRAPPRPKDESPTSTMEACSFRDGYEEFLMPAPGRASAAIRQASRRRRRAPSPAVHAARGRPQTGAIGLPARGGSVGTHVEHGTLQCGKSMSRQRSSQRLYRPTPDILR